MYYYEKGTTLALEISEMNKASISSTALGIFAGMSSKTIVILIVAVIIGRMAAPSFAADLQGHVVKHISRIERPKSVVVNELNEAQRGISEHLKDGDFNLSTDFASCTLSETTAEARSDMIDWAPWRRKIAEELQPQLSGPFNGVVHFELIIRRNGWVTFKSNAAGLDWGAIRKHGISAESEFRQLAFAAERSLSHSRLVRFPEKSRRESVVIADKIVFGEGQPGCTWDRPEYIQDFEMVSD